MDSWEIKNRIMQIPFWYHQIELPGGVLTPGRFPLSRSAYKIPSDLSGKRVLDIGAWDGYWSFEAIKRGAASVVAIDDFSDDLGITDRDLERSWKSFDLCREILDIPSEKCARLELSVYDLRKEDVGEFDIVFFFGTLYHLRHPLLALEKISSVCKGELFIESAICDDYSVYRGGVGFGYPGHVVCEFFPGSEYCGNDSNWWLPSLRCIEKMLEACEFDCKASWKLAEHPKQPILCRGFVRAEKRRTN